MVGPAPKEESLNNFISAASYLLRRTGIKEVKVAGLEPQFDGSFITFLSGLRRVGFERISITTHDASLVSQLEAHARAGLTQLSVSIPHLDERQFGEIAHTGEPTGLQRLVMSAKALGLDPVKINRVLLRGHTNDLDALIDWVRSEGLTVKLFELMSAGGRTPPERYAVRWSGFVDRWLPITERVIVHRYSKSHRFRVQFELRGGGSIETNIMDDKAYSTVATCQTCPLSKHCAEGYLGCGLRVLPDLALRACLLRPELHTDLSSVLEGDAQRSVDAEVDALLDGEVPHPAEERPAAWIAFKRPHTHQVEASP